MATTTNYSWTTPDDTSLVKDGAAAIRSLGSAIDSTVFTNAGNAINKTIVDAKGDIIAATAADTVARLASSGVNDQVLTIDTSTATGLKWAAVAAGPVQLATASLAGVSTYTFTSISGSYKTLFLELKDSRDNSGETMTIQINGSSAGNYNDTRMLAASATNSNQTAATNWRTASNANSVSTSETAAFNLYFPNYAQTNVPKTFYGIAQFASGATAWYVGANTLSTIRTAAITSITLNNNAVNWQAGTLTLYGIN